MDEDRIGLVLAKTSDLRLRIINSIRKSSDADEQGKQSGFKESEAGSVAENRQDDNEEETESLLNIKDALESLEGQLSSLQALQQQQWYEKESALAEIEYSRMKLLKELKEYRGKDLEVIHEAIAFAGETEDNDDLLLPPYPTRLHSDNGHLPSFPATLKLAQNGGSDSGSENLHGKSKNLHESGERGPFKWVKVFLGAAAKTSFTVVGLVAILSLTGFDLKLRRHDHRFKFSDLLKLRANNGKEVSLECPPGKVPVIENGEVRCIVKERVQIPFESAVATPDVRYGCG